MQPLVEYIAYVEDTVGLLSCMHGFISSLLQNLHSVYVLYLFELFIIFSLLKFHANHLLIFGNKYCNIYFG